MEHHRGAANERSDFLVIADIRALKIDRAPHFLQIRLVTGEEIVDRHDFPGTLLKQAADDRRPDESRSPRYDVMAHESPVYDDPNLIRAR